MAGAYIKKYAEKHGVSPAIVYRRIHEIYEKEKEFRLPTAEELKPRKNGRPFKFKKEN